MSDAIRFDDVWRQFGDTPVLRGLTTSVRPGEIYALLGRNGAGKTTALRILLGFLEPHAGTAAILGRDSRELRPEDRARIGYVGEDHRLYGAMRVGAVLDFEAGTRPHFRREFAERAIERCNLPKKQYVAKLSRGQRAQLALLVAVGVEPEVLIFDDPALGLDAVMRRELLDALIDLLADTGCAVLFSSHHLQDVERIADRVGILNDGHLIVDATLDDLKSRVVRRAWSGTGDVPPDVPGRLSARPRRDGFDLTLLDCGSDVEEALRAGGATLSEASTPNLEELFLDLTARTSGGIFSSPEDSE